MSENDPQYLLKIEDFTKKTLDDGTTELTHKFLPGKILWNPHRDPVFELFAKLKSFSEAKFSCHHV